jgi:hypothetical protein
MVVRGNLGVGLFLRELLGGQSDWVKEEVDSKPQSDVFVSF